MNRRDFIKQISFMTSGLVLSNALPGFLRKAAAVEIQRTPFQLSVVTDRPDEALARLENLLKSRVLSKSSLKYAEYRLAGDHLSDMALISGGRLINVHQAQDELSRGLLEIARSLDMPRRVGNPVLMQFSQDLSSMDPEKIQIFVRNQLVEEIDMHENREYLRVAGVQGFVAVAVRQGKANIVEASCRHQTCMKMGSIHHPGQNLICIPNQVRVVVAGQHAKGVDGIVY